MNCTISMMLIMNSSVQFSSIQFSSVQFSSVQFSSVQFSSVQFSSVQFSSVQFSSVQFSSVQFSSVQMYLFLGQRLTVKSLISFKNCNQISKRSYFPLNEAIFPNEKIIKL